MILICKPVLVNCVYSTSLGGFRMCTTMMECTGCLVFKISYINYTYDILNFAHTWFFASNYYKHVFFSLFVS